MTPGLEWTPPQGSDRPLAFTPVTSAQWLRALRAHRGVSQRELAKLAGTPTSTVSRIESGATDPRYSTFSTLVRACALELAVRDYHGALVLRERERESVLDDGDRHQPAHLFLFRTPSESSSRASDWWGWGRVAFLDGDPGVPEWTYRRRRRINPITPLGSDMERGCLWDDAT